MPQRRALDLATHELRLVFCILPRVSVGRHITQGPRGTMLCSVRAQPVPLASDLVPAAREVPIVIAVSMVSNVVRLANVERRAVTLAVVRVVTHRLHANLGAIALHDILVVS